jgi:hypothetical protein
MKKIAVAGLLCTALVGGLATRATAGYKNRFNRPMTQIIRDPGGTMFRCDVGGTRNTPNSTDYCACFVIDYIGQPPLGGCYAAVGADFVFRYFQDPALIAAARSVSGDSTFQFNADANGTPVSLVVAHGSPMEPKLP